MKQKDGCTATVLRRLPLYFIVRIKYSRERFILEKRQGRTDASFVELTITRN